jgi:hypothetical protein
VQAGECFLSEADVLNVGREGNSSPEIVEVSAVDYFGLAPQSVQRQASVAKGLKNHVHTPHRPSDQTVRRHKRAQRLMADQGFVSLPEFFKHKAERAKQRESSEAEPMAAAASTEASMASTAAVEEEEEEEEEVVFVAAAVSAVMEVEEEGEEEEEEEAGTTGTMSPIHAASSNDLGSDSGIQNSSWGPSQTIFYESEESSSSSCDTQSESENLCDTDTWEQDGPHHSIFLDDTAPLQPMDSIPKLLQNSTELQAAQRELSLITRQTTADVVLHGRIEAMVRLLNLYLDKTLGYTWKRVSEVAARSEGHRASCARSTRRWVLTFMRT